MEEISEKEALQVFDGVMLSDGRLQLLKAGRNACFRIVQSGKRHLDWLYFIKDALNILDVEACTGHPKCLRSVVKGEFYDYSTLVTRVSPLLTSHHGAWYSNGIKEVPIGLHLTPISLANWFMGDGSSYRYKRSPATVSIVLATEGFSAQSIEVLEEELHGMGIDNTGRETYKTTIKGAGVAITIRQSCADSFMEIVRPHMLPSFCYKVKFKEGTNR